MKLALRYIPTEVWVDVLCYPWISRKKLGKLVDKFRNRYFAEILQYCLHERGKRTLETVWLEKKAIIPRSPMPENIKFFKRIIISNFYRPEGNAHSRLNLLFLGLVNPVANFHLENSIGDQLDGQYHETKHFRICRHKVEDSARTNLQEWANKTADKSDKSNDIQLYGSTTFGPIDTDAGSNKVDDDSAEQEDGPSTSKKPKMT